jgi:hypothetical protein
MNKFYFYKYLYQKDFLEPKTLFITSCPSNHISAFLELLKWLDSESSMNFAFSNFLLK